jgi:hypothetical protein
VAAAIGLTAIVATTGGALILTHRGGGRSTATTLAPTTPITTTPAATAPATTSPATTSPATTTPPAAGVRPGAVAATGKIHGLHKPFVVDGSRFAVFVVAGQPWTQAAVGATAAVGRRLVFVEVLARRLARPPVDLAALRYKVVTHGFVATPLAGVGTGSRALGPVVAPTLDQLVVSRLAFAVSRSAGPLRLRFAPTNAGGPMITVGLTG